ncbi:UNVERIFIED_CONTAM: two-component system sensor histidine kinase BaeS [Brevibacillus sp. OAP136]
MRKIWFKLALILLAVSLGGIMLSTLLSIKEMDDNFSAYLHDVSRKHNQEIVRLLAASHTQEQGWDKQSFALLQQMADVLDLHIQLYDLDQRFLGDFHERDDGVKHIFDPHSLLPVESGGRTVGYVSIQHNEQAETEELAGHFRSAHTSALVWTTLFVSLLVGVIGIMAARKFVKPVERIRTASLAAASGDLRVRVPVPNGSDELSDLVHSFNQLVATLETQERLRKQLTSDIAHELRTPLNTILAQVEGMIDGIWPATPAHLESTRSEVLRLSQIIHDLDQVIQAELGTGGMEMEELEAGQAVNMLAGSMSAAFAKAQVRLLLDIAPEPVWIVGNLQKIEQVLTNLLANALRHTGVGGEVTVSLVKTDNLLVMQVADNGTGIRPDDLPFVFERFFRGDRARQRETGSGSGLGLSIVKGIVEAHGGVIHIESKLEAGTTVTIRMPLAK